MNIIRKYKNNPILSSKDIPYPADLIFNAGVAKWGGRYVMLFRNDYGYDEKTGMFEGTNLGIAFSPDGREWTAGQQPFLRLDQVQTDEIMRIYDPRLTVLEGALYVCFAMDTRHGVRGGIGRLSDDLSALEILSLSIPDNRNMVLFPEKVNGKYVRLERPFSQYCRKPTFDIWISKSPDLIHWGENELLVRAEDVGFSNDKIGPAAPPVKTPKGWLTTYHGVYMHENAGKNGWEETWGKSYFGGIMLLDLENPAKVVARYDKPLIAPDQPYETEGGFRNDVIFPGGMILEENGEIKIYYGAADTVECLCETTADELLALLENTKG